jgi:iron complex outermembrane receptor protein
VDRDFPALDRRAIALTAATLCSHATWAAGPTVAFEIPAGGAPQTLREFYLQSRVRVLYLADTVKGIETQPVSGTLEASEALARMLEGTGLAYEFENEFSAVIKEAPHAAVTPLADRTPASPGEGPSLLVPPGQPRELEEVLVTGSLIRGVFDITSPLIPMERDEISRAAYGTVQDTVWRLPAASTITRSEIFGGSGNFNRGSSINLRGLGDAATLVLVNGRRQPPAGMDADFVDVSNIPWSMVERIEVLPDGSSALYGSDAIAGVVNIHLRKNLEGAETLLRIGSARSGASEALLAQLLGHHWESGRWLAGYQYSERSALAAADRDYVARADKRPWGGGDYRSIASNPGNILNPLSLLPAFAIPPEQNGKSLDPSDLLPGAVNYEDAYTDVDLLPQKQTHSAYLTLSQDIGERAELSFEGRYGQRDIGLRPMVSSEVPTLLHVPSTNPFYVDPFGDSPFVVLAYDMTNDLGPSRGSGRTRNFFGSLGLELHLKGQWQLALSGSYGGEDLNWQVQTFNPTALDEALADPDPTTAFNPFGDGSNTHAATLEKIRATGRLMARSRISAVQLVADGPLFATQSGIAKAAAGLEYREERLLREALLGEMDDLSYRSRFGRQIAAAFAELSLPLMGDPSDLRAAPRLELSLATRYERYADFGTTYNPKLGIRWTPLESLKLRASWGTAFRAPNLVDVEGRSIIGLISVDDPTTAPGRTNALVLQGSNPDLKEERATAWTAGFDLAPNVFPGFRLSATAYSIKYEDQVIQPGLLTPLDVLIQQDEWAEIITRNPSQREIETLCASQQFFGNPSDCASAQPAIVLDLRKHNLSTTDTAGLDLTIEQSVSTNLGRFSFQLNAMHVFHYRRAFTTRAPIVDIVDTVNNPLALRLRGTIEWNQHRPNEDGMGLYLTAAHAAAYRDRESPTRRYLPAWTTIDLGFQYRTGPEGKWPGNIELGFNVANVLDDHPPFADREIGYDVINAQPMGRILSAYVSKRW